MHREHILCQVDSAGNNVAHKTSPFRWSIGNAHTLQSWHSCAPSGRGSPLHSLGGHLGIFIAAYLIHAARVACAAVAMLVAGGTIWFVLGVLTAMAGIQTGTVVLICLVSVVLGAVAIGSYVSIRCITPNSILHPVIAAAAVALAVVTFAIRGDVGVLPVVVPLCAAAFAVLSAFIARSITTRPNKSIERTRGE